MVYDEYNPDEKTYCSMSLKIIQLMRIQLIAIFVKFIIIIIQMMTFDDFYNWYYSDVPDVFSNELVAKLHP